MNHAAEVALTRDGILAGQLSELIRVADPSIHILTDSELERSRDDALAEHEGGDVWVFAYGSLIWNPTFHFVDRRPSRLFGYHRSFCLRTRAGRGTLEQPGLMLGLEAGGSCNGVTYCIAESAVKQETWVLWKREMVVGSYLPRWLTVWEGAVRRRALAFVINRRHPMYAGRLPRSEVVRTLATAAGRMGTASDYLFNIVAGLGAFGIRDSHLTSIAREVQAFREDGDEDR